MSPLPAPVPVPEVRPARTQPTSEPIPTPRVEWLAPGKGLHLLMSPLEAQVSLSRHFSHFLSLAQSLAQESAQPPGQSSTQPPAKLFNQRSPHLLALRLFPVGAQVSRTCCLFPLGARFPSLLVTLENVSNHQLHQPLNHQSTACGSHSTISWPPDLLCLRCHRFPRCRPPDLIHPQHCHLPCYLDSCA